MVLLVDFNYAPHSPRASSPFSHQIHPPPPELPKSRANPNATNPLAKLVAHYPALASVATHLDHNDLQNLAMTGQHFRCSLWPVRRSLLAISLRCMNSASGRGRERCAADLVNPCLKCREPICRNCKTKTKPTALISRLRRLCPPCQRSAPAAAPPYCACDPDPWVCTACIRALGSEDEIYRTIGLFCIDGHDTVVYGASDGGKIRCARGRQRCLGLEPDPAAVIEDSTNDSDSSVDANGDIVPVGSGADQWDALTVALDELGEEYGWGKVEKRASRAQAQGGRIVNWESGKWDMAREWSGELRGWCAWCDMVVLSKVDKRRMGIE